MKGLVRTATALALVFVGRAASADARAPSRAPVALTITDCDAPGFADLRAASQLELAPRPVTERSGGDAIAATAFCIGSVVEVRVVRPLDLRLYSRVLDLRRAPVRARARAVAGALAALVDACDAPARVRSSDAPPPSVLAPAVTAAAPAPAAAPPEPVATPPRAFVLSLDAGVRASFGSPPSLGTTGVTVGPLWSTLAWFAGLRFELGNAAGVVVGTHATAGLSVRTEFSSFALTFAFGLRLGALGGASAPTPWNAVLAPTLGAALSVRLHHRVAVALRFDQGVDVLLRASPTADAWFTATLGPQVSIP